MSVNPFVYLQSTTPSLSDCWICLQSSFPGCKKTLKYYGDCRLATVTKTLVQKDGMNGIAAATSLASISMPVCFSDCLSVCVSVCQPFCASLSNCLFACTYVIFYLDLFQAFYTKFYIPEKDQFPQEVENTDKLARALVVSCALHYTALFYSTLPLTVIDN